MYSFRGIALPDNLKDSIDAYFEQGRPTGDFIRACLENNLTRAVMLADETSAASLQAIVGYLYNECATSRWGSPLAVKLWLEEKHAERERNAVQCESVGAETSREVRG